jgi:hypothetical protein
MADGGPARQVPAGEIDVLMDDEQLKARAVSWSRYRVISVVSATMIVVAVVAIAGALLAESGHEPTAAARRHPHQVARRTVPLADSSLTPSGWAPVPYFAAQVSVPASWYVEKSGGSVCGGGMHGMIFLNQPPRLKFLRAMGCQLARNVVVLTTLRRRPSPSASTTMNRSGVVNGLRVLSRRHNGEDMLIAPSLGVQLTARGPLAPRVLATLTRSPLSVALARGPVLPVPGGWRWHRFGGITFAAPGSWSLIRSNWWGGCPYGLAARTILLSTAATLFVPSCPAPPQTAGFEAARPGIVIGAGRYATLGASKLSHAACLDLHGFHACVAANGYGGGLLTLAINVPGRSQPVIVEIGLSGSGALPRTIIESIGPRSAGVTK